MYTGLAATLRTPGGRPITNAVERATLKQSEWDQGPSAQEHQLVIAKTRSVHRTIPEEVMQAANDL